MIAAAVASLPAAEVVRRATAAGIPSVRARKMQELTSDEQLIRHGLLAVTDSDESGVARVGSGRWLEMPGLSTAPPGDAPGPDEHREAILREVALGADDRQAQRVT
jgi:crotonobetainyl-CoA:carnitine CoA-transferase CaiB-like acyl-CoA transferase